MSRLLFGFATFLGAGLLFGVQPMVGRALLPRLGGAPLVWIVCLAFFQAALFAGYLWVHLATRRLASRIQLLIQLGLLALALALGPLRLDLPLAAELDPSAALLGFMVSSVGLAYVALASTTPLLQLAYARASGRRPYRLYAVSNAGSLLGLLVYPLWIETHLDLDGQARIWSRGFALYGALILALTLLLIRCEGEPEERAKTPAPPLKARGEWFALSAAPAALLAAVTDHVTVDVAAGPLVWVLALALYLLTFSLAFVSRRPRFPQLHRGLWIACSVALPIMLLPGNQVPLPVMLAVPAVTLWSGAFLCHAELAARSPDSESLTHFYVWLAAGGAAGGGFVAFAAPVLLDGRYELVLSMLAVHLLLGLSTGRRDRREAPSGAQRLSWLGMGLAVPVLLATLYAQVTGAGRPGRLLERSRNFFGPVEVVETDAYRTLIHGRTYHGRQSLDPARAGDPVAYFGPDSGVGRALRLHHLGQPRSIGVLGLGVGNLAAYAQSADRMRFYEIDPEVTRLARTHFGFLAHAAGRVDVVHGDGRLLLTGERDRRFDVLVLDAFSSDSVPVHLLTREAFDIYLKRLAPDGLLLANVSNRHLAVERVVAGSARAHGLAVEVIESPADPARGLMRARWALMARDASNVGAVLEEPVKRMQVSAPVLWTDRRASVFEIAGGP